MVRRLETLESTRERITAAAFDLHATIGPSRTTISRIAERAGVQRHTVYHHFPNLDALYAACTEHGIRATSMPVATSWDHIADPMERMRAGLADIYAWFRANERMLANVLHDIDPEAPPPTEPDVFEIRMMAVHAALAGGWVASDGDRASLDALITHAMAFDTWRSLTSAGLADHDAIELLVRVATRVAAGTL